MKIIYIVILTAIATALLVYAMRLHIIESPSQKGVHIQSPSMQKEIRELEEIEYSVTTLFDPLARVQGNPEPIEAVTLSVPFTPQAPLADWNPPFDEACEEASLLMVEYALRNHPLSPQMATKEIRALVHWEEQNGYPVDVTSVQTAQFARSYLNRLAIVYTEDEVTVSNIKKLLAAGYPVIIPVAGQELHNPYFSGEGPPYHMLVIIGWKPKGLFADEHFVTNDPGTKRGEGYTYDVDTIMEAIHDWTGSKETIINGRKAMVIMGQ